METLELNLPARLDSSFAQQLQADLLQRRGQALTVDASLVERPGTLCFQVLLSAEATWKLDGQDFHIARPSPAFRDAAGILGLAFQEGAQE